MTDINNRLKKELAQEYYLKDTLTQKAIAEKVDISEHTLSIWVNEGKWAEKRTTLLVTKTAQLRSLYDQLAKLNELNLEYLTDDDPNTNPNYDAVCKLTNSIKKLEIHTGIGENIETLMEFVKFVQAENFELSKEITTWADVFIKSKLKDK